MKFQLTALVAAVAALLGSIQSAPQEAKVPLLALYYESLCPGCHEFITGQLAPAYQKLENLIDIELVPYGNAEEINGAIQCQHGPEECFGNVVQACLMASNGGDPKESLTFITCMIEQPNAGDTHASALKCATDLKLNWSSLSACADGPEGAKLIAANKKKTDALSPAHQYVPWITVNGFWSEPNEDKMTTNLVKFLCDNYLSKDLPECKNSEEGSSIPAAGRCDKDE